MSLEIRLGYIGWFDTIRRSYEFFWQRTSQQSLLRKPFKDHIDEATEAAESMAKAVMQCDILIVLYAEGGIGFHIETGGALVASLILSFITGQKKKQIYVVGQGNDRSVFYFHRSVNRVPDVATLIEDLKKLSLISQNS